MVYDNFNYYWSSTCRKCTQLSVLYGSWEYYDKWVDSVRADRPYRGPQFPEIWETLL